jgi:hypothetical protein
VGIEIKNKKKPGGTMEYTENQVNAIKLFNKYVEGSDFCESDDTSEWFEYGWMNEIFGVLLKNGWTQKTAEGTIGSLIEKGVIYKYDMMRGSDTPDGKDQWLWVVKWVDLDKEVA